MGTTAVVTGGARGLGREIATAMHAAGHRVVIGGRNKEALDETATHIDPTGKSVLAVVCDVRDEASVDQLASAAVARFETIDILVANSGIAGPTAPLWETQPREWLDTIHTNLFGTFLCCRAFLPTMINHGSGSIVIIGSMTGKRPLYGRTGYAASKTALIGLTRTLAAEAGPYGVRVNLISPGPLEGERIEQVLQAQAASRSISVTAARAEMLTDSPLGRLVPPADVAAAAVFLVSPGAASITGEDLNVSAGIVNY
ncbi:3-oxoacyl-ACP reductase FabG [Acidothermaceae bacterium B102]|nr:3-oxoacyl-ACP reductase FabG [Acidothermaceae bacterium B102]